VSVRPERDAKRSGEPKVGELEVAVLVDEQVLGLEIAVEDPVGVAVVEALDELQRESLQSSVPVGRSAGRNGADRAQLAGRRDGQLGSFARLKRTLTSAGPRPSSEPIVSMYFFRSMSRNSKTR
jgi:hypothetical protein